MRVIAGSARRTPLVAPGGLETRPTSDMAKEGLFNILTPKLSGASFLDLYSGSGAIGIEALSRGAKEAVFVDKSPAAIEALKANLKKTRLGENAYIHHADSMETIVKLCANSTKFSIIFIDPPYSCDLLPRTLETLSGNNILDEGGLVVAESDSKQIDNIPSSLYLTGTRKYGRAFFHFFKAVRVIT